MIMAREALSRIIALGRPVREAASFLADKCYHLELHGWAYVNSDELQPVPHEIWPALMWSSLPDDAGLISDTGGKLGVIGDWFAGRIGYWPRQAGPFSKRYNIQGMRFDRDEFEALLPEKALTWYCEPIGAKPLTSINGAAAQSGSKSQPDAPTNRQLNHQDIIERAASMLAEQPGLSKGSAAASIVADLPCNRRTGKPRDTRHIERMIAHLWDGGISDSPR
jgi:hypothetical protein